MDHAYGGVVHVLTEIQLEAGFCIVIATFSRFLATAARGRNAFDTYVDQMQCEDIVPVLIE